MVGIRIFSTIMHTRSSLLQEEVMMISNFLIKEKSEKPQELWNIRIWHHLTLVVSKYDFKTCSLIGQCVLIALTRAPVSHHQFEKPWRNIKMVGWDVMAFKSIKMPLSELQRVGDGFTVIKQCSTCDAMILVFYTLVKIIQQKNQLKIRSRFQFVTLGTPQDLGTQRKR